MLFPQSLNKNEYVRVMKINKNEGLTISKYVKTFEEFFQLVQRNKYYFDLYVGLSTVEKKKGKLSGTSSYQCKRHVLFLDFDKKDYPELKKVREFSDLIKTKTNIYTHMCVDSGHGYHYYICTKPTREIRLLTDINRNLITLTGADSRAGNETQIARIPTSYNHKLSNGNYDYNTKNKDKWKYVTVVNHGLDTSNFYRYRLDRLQDKIAHDIQTERILSEKPVIEYEPKTVKQFYCIDKILHTGAAKGERNFWLGRITNMHKMNGTPYELVKADIIKWNSICQPPKPEKTLIDDFNRYWNGNYNLLGCVDALTNERDRNILASVCDKALCFSNTHINISKSDGIKMSKGLLNKTRIRELSGYCYLLLTLIYMYQDNYGTSGFTVSNLKKRLTTKLGHGRCKIINQCMSRQTMYKCLWELRDKGIITVTAPKNNPNAKISYHKLRIVKRFRDFEDGYIQFYNAACIALRLGAIEYNDYRVYLCLIYHLQNCLPCTYENLASYLNIDKSIISKSINNLEQQGLLIIKKLTTESRHTTYNHYIINNPDSINGIALKSENEKCEFDSIEITMVA